MNVRDSDEKWGDALSSTQSAAPDGPQSDTRKSRALFAEERQQAIEALLREAGRVEVAALAARYEVSEDSIRRDLRALAQRGLVQKTHGGAVALNLSAMPMSQRGAVKLSVKRGIGRAAAARVQAHQTLFIDSGSTAFALAQALCAEGSARPLTVVTASLDVAQLLGADMRVALVMAGGEWSHDTRAFSGPQAEAVFRAMRADWAFIGACALHPVLGLSASHAGDAALKRTMLSGAAERVLLADASKFGLVQPHAVASLEQVDRVITDSAPPWLREQVRTLEEIDPA